MKSTNLYWIVCLICLVAHTCKAQNNAVNLYTVPVQVNDGWETGRANAFRISEDSLDVLLNLIGSTPPQDFRALAITRHGKLVLDTYFNSYNRNTLHDIRSAAKSITALLVGIAVDQGLIADEKVSLYSLFKRSDSLIEQDRRKAAITLYDALTMQTGLDADAYNNNSPGNEANWLDSEDDWVDFVLRLPMTSEKPGTRHVYNSASALLAGAAVENASGLSLREFAGKHFFSPMMIPEFYWAVGPQNRTAGMGNLYLTNRAMAKIGQMVLDKGKWNGKQIVSARWIDALSEKHSSIPVPVFDTHSYGYMWYLGTKDIEGRDVDFIYASGNGGNVIYVVPQYNMVVTMLSSAYSTNYGSNRSNNIFEYILRAVNE